MSQWAVAVLVLVLGACSPGAEYPSQTAEPGPPAGQPPAEGQPQGFCGGIAGVQCADGFFCDFPEGHCGHSDRGGVCRPVPQLCTMHYDPVCGCDGKLYGNACSAHGAGVSVANPTFCAPQT